MSNRRSLFMRGIPSLARRLMFLVAVVACVSLAMPTAVYAQVTTGNIAGAVTDASGAALPGVTVEAVHVPTGTHYTAISDASGRFTMPNVRVGGPYKVTGALEGMKPANVSDITVNLGSTTEVALKMNISAVTEAITVTANADSIINADHTGATSSVSTRQIESLPTVNRTLQDFARTNPYFTTDLSDSNGTTLNVAGRNNRYNNIQIDGAVNNDLFGLAPTGTPGGLTDTQPISLDTIQEIQVAISPYDIKQGGFTGGAINAITRSGTNEFHGSVYGSSRNQN
ncbi:MAG TPA: TonB-dependent receptor, partial [Thermoanaerobaculia bacterium]